MTVNCPTCQKPGYEPDETLRALRNFNWDEVRWSDVGDKLYDTPMGTIEVVSDIPAMAYDSYGSTVDGDVSVVILLLSDGRLFKREAYRDSYGSVEWRYDIREVKAEPRTITVYDYK